MTKLFSIIAVAVLATTFVACGPSAEEKAKIEEQKKRTADSIQAATTQSLENSVNDATATGDSTTTTGATTTTTTDAHAH